MSISIYGTSDLSITTPVVTTTSSALSKYINKLNLDVLKSLATADFISRVSELMSDMSGRQILLENKMKSAGNVMAEASTKALDAKAVVDLNAGKLAALIILQVGNPPDAAVAASDLYTQGQSSADVQTTTQAALPYISSAAGGMRKEAVAAAAELAYYTAKVETTRAALIRLEDEYRELTEALFNLNMLMSVIQARVTPNA